MGTCISTSVLPSDQEATILARAVSVITDVSQTNKLTDPMYRSQVVAMYEALEAQGIDLTDPDEQELMDMFNHELRMLKLKVEQQLPGIVAFQMMVVIQAVAELVYDGNVAQAVGQLKGRVFQANDKTSARIQKWWPRYHPLTHTFVGLTAAKQAKMVPLVKFMKQFLSCHDRDATDQRISKQAYCQMIRQYCLDQQTAPGMQPFLILGLTTEDFIHAFTAEPLPKWLSYTDIYAQMTYGAEFVGQGVTTKATIAADTRNSCNARALQALRVELMAH